MIGPLALIRDPFSLRDIAAIATLLTCRSQMTHAEMRTLNLNSL